MRQDLLILKNHIPSENRISACGASMHHAAGLNM
ncbi:hypothetical protein HCH_04104 [Hahella chejuensis KCTC 2396]|uniref:Uncharacterized protein n=1 Tax=Hahella chejuensis (strain KCTC 2396) TaxID=349521 RepID=Q2SEV9_HAHCH|nr:hypothetical protein HCH_04104 [Hahella chejuensis KCTC 2396]